MSIISAGDTGAADLPEISNSLRFDGTNDYLSRSVWSGAIRTTWSFSCWAKRGKLGVEQVLFGAYDGVSTYASRFYFTAGDALAFDFGGSAQNLTVTSAVFRDTSSHYHILLVLDTVQTETAHNTTMSRVRIYVNGVQQTTSGTLPGYNLNGQFFINAQTTRIGVRNTEYFDGYLSYVCVVVGQPRFVYDFASTDPNGQWRSRSKATLQSLAAGAANSFFLPFDDGSSTTTLGNDASGYGNNWTLNNMVRDGSVNDCWSYDTPTNNFAVGSNVDCDPQVSNSAASGAMHWLSPSGGVFWRKRRATMPLNGSNRYWECTCMVASGTYYGAIGVLTDAAIMHDPSNFTGGYLYGYNGQKYINGTASAFGASFTINDIISFYYDDSLKTLDCYKNNVLQGTISLPGSVQLFAGLTSYGQSFIVNFGQQSFVYTPPTSAKALNTKNLPIPTGAASAPNEHFQTKLDTGADIKSTCETVFPSNFMEWIKDRAVSNNNQLVDIVRGTGAVLQSNTTAAETTYSTPSGSCVGWVWKAGGAAVSNSEGTITSQVSANTAAGFSIVSYTGNGLGSQTIGHGLGVVPKLIFEKDRDGSAAGFAVHGCGQLWTPGTSGLLLSGTGGLNPAMISGDGVATSTVYKPATPGYANVAGHKHIAYCFAEVPGFSKIGSYTGNGSTDGPFVWCGFRPKYVLIKRSDASGEWVIFDSTRATYNVNDTVLFAHLSNAEQGPAAGYGIDFTANGFKVRSASINVNGGTLIFMAFAEAPFKYANAR